MLTTQTFVQKKVFGNHLQVCRPLEYRRNEWQELNKGRERSVRLIVKAMLGVPSAHLGEQEHAMWCFQLPAASLVVLYIHRGSHVEIAVRMDDENEVHEIIDFLLEEVSTKLQQL